MVQLALTSVLLSWFLLFLANVNVVYAAPVVLEKRIAQVIADSTAKWEQACLAAGGAQKCNAVSITAFTTLLAAAGICEQQDAADSMIDLAKTLNNDPTMIQLTQIFLQQPRNTPNSLAVPYCNKAPKNAELNGLFQCQFQGAKQDTFVGNLALGQPTTIPFGLSAALNPLGSCLANPSGPIADGTQLVSITTNPGVGSSTSTSTASGMDNSNGGSSASASQTTSVAASTTSSASSSSSSSSSSDSSGSSSSTDFHAQNAKDAQALNAKFATLTADSACTDGEQACVQGSFAQCVSGKFELTSCGDLTCVALPLVNKAGTSITCDTEADAVARIQASGGSASLTGDGSTSSSSSSSSSDSNASDNSSSASTAADASSTSTSSSTSSSSSSSNSSSGDFHVQNAKDAQALNAKFATLTAGSACTDGEQACVQGQFAQCVSGKFALTSCGSLTCVALPLVNKAGTSVTCDTEADAIARIKASGGSASLT